MTTMPLPEAQATMAFLSNELRKAVETAAAQYQVIQQMKAEIERLKKDQKAEQPGPVDTISINPSE